MAIMCLSIAVEAKRGGIQGNVRGQPVLYLGMYLSVWGIGQQIYNSRGLGVVQELDESLYVKLCDESLYVKELVRGDELKAVRIGFGNVRQACYYYVNSNGEVG